MAKKMLGKFSTRFSRHKSNDSGFLNPDTSIIDKEQTFWWRHLEENTFMQHSIMHDDINETTKQLSLNSKLDSSQDDNSKWWKNLNLSHNKHNVSTDSIQNISAAVMETNVLQKSSSESDKEINIKKKKLLRLKLDRTSKSNAFLNVLNDTETNILIRSPRKKKAASTSFNNSVSDKISEKIHRSREDSLNLSSTANIVKLRPNIFKEKNNRWINDQDASQNILAEDDVIDDSVGKNLSASGRSTISPSKMGNKIVFDNNSIFNTTIQNNEESDSNRTILKSKSRLMNINVQKSMEKNVFEDAVVQNRNSNLSTHNLNQEINIHDKKLIGSLNTSRDLYNLSNKDPNVSVKQLSKSNYDTKLYNNSKNISKKAPKSMRKEREVCETVNDMSDTINNEQDSSKLMKESFNSNPKKKTIGDENATSNVQMVQRNFNTLGDKTNSKTISKQLSSLTAENSNRIETEDRQILHKQNTLRKSQNYHNTAIRTSNKDVSFTASKMNSSKTLRTIDNFFKIKQSTVANKQLNMSSQAFMDADKMKKINNKLKRIKNRKKVIMKANTALNRESMTRARSIDNFKETNNKKLLTNPTKIVDKAFLINGKIYKAPKLPRPKHWVTDRLYTFLWKRMESKYMLATRVQSEKFVQNLAKIVTLIQRRKMYNNYKFELESLMKEMARLEIISTRSDFYNFCQDFLPHDFRVKVVPMLLPGNKKLVPYDPNELYIPLESNK